MPDLLENIVFSEDIWSMDCYRGEQ